MLTGKHRRNLRALGHSLASIIQVGKNGLDDALIGALDQALTDHELVKVKLEAECPDDRFGVAERLGTEPGVNVVQILGRTLLLYKRHPQTPRFEGKRAVAASAPGQRSA